MNPSQTLAHFFATLTAAATLALAPALALAAPQTLRLGIDLAADSVQGKAAQFFLGA